MHPVVRLIRAILRLALRIFFRRVELDGVERVPLEGPLIFVLNHPNGLIDPVFLLCLSPRPVSYVAKSTLFRMPVIGYLVRAFDSLPVQRRQDAATGTDNGETFARARDLLGRGGSLGIFPEGISHSGPRLAPLKTGAARIALGTGLEDIKIVPAGLYYTDKAIFRSEALVYFGPPLAVEAAPLGDDGEPPREAVRALTDRIEAALGEVTLQADERAALALIDRAARLLAAAAGGGASTLGDNFALRRRLIAGYGRLRAEAPAELDALIARIGAYETEVRALGLDPDHPPPEALSAALILRIGLRSLLLLAVFAPLALVGTVIHYPAYRAIGLLARRIARGDDDLIATIKMLGALLLFPLSWALAGLALGLAGGGALAGLGLALAAPLSGWIALGFWERVEWLAAGARLSWVWLTKRSLLGRLAGERAAIYEAVVALDHRLGV